MVTLERLKAVLDYEPETGLFRWKRSKTNTKCGQIAGSKSGCGYIYIEIDGIAYLAHRLAWLYMTGEWPSELDHIDLDKTNNTISNLRVADRSQNCCNKKIRADNKSGVPGVNYHTRLKKWVARIAVRGKRYSLGCFESLEEAAAAREQKLAEFHGEF
ncbi:MAG TPA: HNH endonuclease, partial [Methylocella sp.]|nr:HNH endonuclease [Methylocella sp.]